MNALLLTLIITIALTPVSDGLICHVCSTVKKDKCYYGKSSLKSLRCREPASCIAFKFDVESKSGNYTRTVRGCRHVTNNLDVCQVLMREVKSGGGTIERGKWCKVCNRNFCNNSAKFSFNWILVVFLSVVTSLY